MKKVFLSLILGILILGVFAFGINLVSSVGEVSYCCERSVGGAWCQNSPPAECDDSYRTIPSSCEATAYCKLGTCFNSLEGTCMENTPQIVCNDNNGVWDERDVDELDQCGLGCCFIGDGASFVTLTRCKRLTALYGVETNYRTDIQSEVECIASAFPEEKGACVFEKEFERTCRFLTRSECQGIDGGSETVNVKFHEGFLCSAESLATECGPDPSRTTCVEDKDEVYFVDTCGNLANIYDASMRDNQNYWTYIKEKDESCVFSENSASCGNCDYFSGSTCKAYERGNRRMINPQYGNNVCADLDCQYNGGEIKHGETVCATSGNGKNLPGEEHFRLVCYDGEITEEPCAAFRQEVCVESDINGFRQDSCSINLWRDCYAIDNKEDCEDIGVRDCEWMVGASMLHEGGTPSIVDEDDFLIEREDLDDKTENGASCVPKYAPGFMFWGESSDIGESASAPLGFKTELAEEAEQVCAFASTTCLVKYELSVLGGLDWDCKENCWCIEDNEDIKEDWENKRNTLCTAVGDCGISTNYRGKQGYYDESQIVIEILEPEED